MRISSREWRENRWFDGLVVAFLAHAVAVVVLGVVVEQRGRQPDHARPVRSRERPEELRFIAPPVEPRAPRHLAHSNPEPRHLTTPPRETPVPARDTGAAIATTPGAVPSTPAVAPAPAGGLLASGLSVDRRLLVGPAAAGGVADVRVREANASIVAGLRAYADSVRRHDYRWTVGDSTHRFGIAKCGIALSRICIPFGFSYMPSSAPAFSAVDRNRGDDADLGASIARVRARNSKPGDDSARTGP